MWRTNDILAYTTCLHLVPAQFLQNPSLPTCLSLGGFKHKFKTYFKNLYQRIWAQIVHRFTDTLPRKEFATEMLKNSIQEAAVTLKVNLFMTYCVYLRGPQPTLSHIRVRSMSSMQTLLGALTQQLKGTTWRKRWTKETTRILNKHQT